MARAAEQHHDVAGVRALRHGQDQPGAVLRRCAIGERADDAPACLRGKPITIPVLSPLPAISSVPWVETWRGLALHLRGGMQLTLVMRTLVTCGLPPSSRLRGRRWAPGPRRPAAVAPGGGPPALAASGRRSAGQVASTAAERCCDDALVQSLDRLWALLGRQDNPLRGEPVATHWAASEVSRSLVANRR